MLIGDSILRQAVDAKEVPGVVALAATDRGLFDVQGHRFRREDAAGRAGQAQT